MVSIALKQENVSNLTAFTQLINNKNKDQIQVVCLTGFILTVQFALVISKCFILFVFLE